MIDPLRRDRATASAPPRARAARPAQAPRARRDEAPAGGCLHDRGPAEDREAPDTEGRVRLHRWRGRGRDLACEGAPGVPGRRVPPGGAARRLDGGHERHRPRRSVRAPVRHRPHRLHASDAHRGRARRRRRRGRGRDPVLALDARHDVDRGRRAREPARPQLVPALHVEGSRARGRADRARRESRLRHAARDRRRPRLGRPDPRPSQRPDDPARAPTPQRRRRAPPSALVDRLPHHRAARLRRPRRVAGHGRGVSRPDVRSERRLRRPRVDQGAVAGQARGEGRPDAGGREAGRRGRCRRDRRSRTTAAASSTGHPCLSISSQTWCARSAGRRRSTSTPGS